MQQDYQAFVVNQTSDGFNMGIERLKWQECLPGEVVVKVAYAAVNYKDALVCTPGGKIARTYPLVPGIECAGVVVESQDSRFQSGDAVLASDFGDTLGVSRHGGYREYACLPGDFLSPLRGLNFRQALVLSGGVTATMAVRQLEIHGLTQEKGPVLVTGATGGVASLAISLLASRGYQVVASTGKADAHAYLRQLGASEILSREEVAAESSRPLEAQRWAGSIDTVGGATLAYLMRTTIKGGAIAAVGVTGGAAFHATVYPLILRGIKILGIDMPSTPLHMRQQIWEEMLYEKHALNLVDMIASEVTLEDVPRVTKAMLRGKTRGRILIRMSDE